MIVGVLKEPSFESRVSLLAEGVSALVKKGIEVWVEPGAGERAFCSDDDYTRLGATLHKREELWRKADILLGIHPPEIPAELTTTAAAEASAPPEIPVAAGGGVGGGSQQNKILIGIYQPLYNTALMSDWAGRSLTSFSLDMLPRTTRAQSMDVLSSQANIAGYKAVLVAANESPRYFPMFMTAAGSIPPAKALILGAGVAGLQAIATARRLGAVVEVFDTRPAVKEEVMSLGAKFIEVEGAADASKAGGYAVEQDDAFRERQKARIGESIAKADIVVTTAQIPGKKAPILVTRGMIEAMRRGSVIVDLAAATGGNTELTKNGTTIVHEGVSIVGHSSLASTMPYDASKLYGRNVTNFLQLITGKDGSLQLNFEDDLVKGCCITHGGEIVHGKIKELRLQEIV